MNYDLIIIGAGPAGTSAAISAARQGARVLLLERGRFPRHTVCGDFVSAESLGLLADLLDPDPAPLIDHAPRIPRARRFPAGRPPQPTRRPRRDQRYDTEGRYGVGQGQRNLAQQCSDYQRASGVARHLCRHDTVGCIISTQLDFGRRLKRRDGCNSRRVERLQPCSGRYSSF